MIKTNALVLGLLLVGGLVGGLVVVAPGARAQDDPAEDRGLVLWDQNIARALDRLLLEPEECAEFARSANSDERCEEAGRALSQFERVTDLDRFVLFVDRYANARFNRQISDSTRVDFRADVPDVLRQRADFKVQLKVKF
jgi:hypothetical protein